MTDKYETKDDALDSLISSFIELAENRRKEANVLEDLAMEMATKQPEPQEIIEAYENHDVNIEAIDKIIEEHKEL